MKEMKVWNCNFLSTSQSLLENISEIIDEEVDSEDEEEDEELNKETEDFEIMEETKRGSGGFGSTGTK